MFSRRKKPLCEETFASLFECWKERLFGYVLAITHSRYVAEEITQEIFLKLWLSRQDLHLIENEEAYLFTIARNKVLNYLRKARYEEKLAATIKQRMSQASNDVEEHLSVVESGRLVQEAVTMLSPQRQKVYNLSRLQGLNHEQIAHQMRLSPNTVKNHLVHALRFIRTYLDNCNVLMVIFFLWGK